MTDKKTKKTVRETPKVKTQRQIRKVAEPPRKRTRIFKSPRKP
jgi:hypothetical protein